MRVHTPTEHDTVATPNAEMTSLATPRRGSRELSAWRVRMAPGARGPWHSVDREQVWLPLTGTLAVTSGDGTAEPWHVGPGQAAVLPAGEPRQVSTAGGEAVEALVCMTAGGRATVTETGEIRTIPWAE
ncbi:cupin domain-containing protein [Streptomyces millisiae]|uniref:Cupin domain-containing protein n=1 Tax=Streptomyces millisiae TaxID=3075542 RepID=A0ABU2LRC8_9ACTN|nr:cupin domain-containing protein [Streptomyces sp. DSM 44918]MDT0320132.1 cupin domain-containing protein [Streptomyces sp. DSM 44918]